jgi:hypothetical protein
MRILLAVAFVFVAGVSPAYSPWLNVPTYISLHTVVIGREISLSLASPTVTMAEMPPSLASRRSAVQFFAVYDLSAPQLRAWSIVCRVLPFSDWPGDDEFD